MKVYLIFAVLSILVAFLVANSEVTGIRAGRQKRDWSSSSSSSSESNEAFKKKYKKKQRKLEEKRMMKELDETPAPPAAEEPGSSEEEEGSTTEEPGPMDKMLGPLAGPMKEFGKMFKSSGKI